MPEMKRNETLQLNYDGIILLLRLDYEEGTASFVNDDDLGQKFLFKDRGTEYLGGWVLVFRALEEATKVADQKLREQCELRSNAVHERLIDTMLELSEIPKATGRAKK